MTMCVLGDTGTKHTLTVHLYMVADRSSRNRQLKSVLIPFRGVCYLACCDSRTLMICVMDVCMPPILKHTSSGICALKATRAFLVCRWSLNNSSAYKVITGKAGLLLSSSLPVSLLTSGKYRFQDTKTPLCGFGPVAFFGDCIFRVDPSGLLTRGGSCSTQSGSLSLSGMSIKALAADVFSNLSSVR